jgi:DNA/RNA endonuclease YhcR with UshA esterase domain
MGGAHPNEAFTAFIASPDAEKFQNFKDYKGATITVSGKIEDHNGKPQIAVTAPSQIVVKSETSGDKESKPATSASATPKSTP